MLVAVASKAHSSKMGRSISFASPTISESASTPTGTSAGKMEEDWWTTVYAAHFLWEAKKAGFDVDNSLMETMLSYLANRLKTRETINYYYNRDQNKKIAPKEVAYSLYVLSLAGRPQVSAMNYYKANNAMLALDGRYLLSAAYAISGDKKSFNSMLPGSFSGCVLR